MSQENVEIVRRAWEAWSRGDLEALFALYDRKIEWDLNHYPQWPKQNIYRGHEGLGRFFERWLAAWEDYEAGVEQILDTGQEQVVALCWQRGTARASRALTEMDFGQIFTLRPGKIVRIDNYADRAEALEAAGLSE